MTPRQLSQSIRRLAREAGFDLCGISQSFQPQHGAYYLEWLRLGKHGEMGWLARNTDKRLNPDTILPGCRSVICVAASYAHSHDQHDGFRLAKYAHGRDYHLWMKERLELFAKAIQTQCAPNFVWRSFVDTGPVLERDLAAQAGLGWIGKNTCLIHETSGSFLFLGEIFCNLDLEADAPTTDQCGKCTLCLDHCPTQALTPYQLDAQKCLAYQNIEKRGVREEALRDSWGEWLVGCDICQDVCPWNRKAEESHQKEWLSGFRDYLPSDFPALLRLTKTQYHKRVKDSAVSRIKYEDFMRNVFVVISGQKRVDLYGDVLSWKRTHPALDLPEWEACVSHLKRLLPPQA